MQKYKQYNKKAWSEKDQVALFKFAKQKAHVSEIAKHVDKNEKSIKNKLYHMGFSTRDGIVL